MRRGLIPAALGRRPARLVLKRARILDVFTQMFFTGDIAIEDGIIAGVGRYSGEREIPLEGRFVVPGFIDAHVHIESAMVTPSIFAAHVLARGTTAVIADPHEIANVTGLSGVRYLLEEAKTAPIHIYLMLPSAVPLGDFDQNGGDFGLHHMKKVYGHPEVLGLGEVMDTEAVLGGDAQIWEKMDLNREKVLDGHLPGIAGKELQALALAGIQTDHECTGWEETLEKLRAGIFVALREGSAARNVTDIVRGAVAAGAPVQRCGFCTDDRHLSDIDAHGHIDNNIRLAIAAGLSPAAAFSMAGINTARAYGLRDMGAVAPGFQADLVVLEDLESVKISGVYKSGRTRDELLRRPARPAPEAMKHTVRIGTISPKRLALRAPEGTFPVISIVPGQILTQREDMRLPVDERGFFVPRDGLLKVAVIQRHGGGDDMAVGVLRGFGLRDGAMATTVGHDAHNLIVVGDNDTDMLLAVRTAARLQGGYVLCGGGRVLGELPLPVAGLLSDDPSVDIPARTRALKTLCHGRGVPENIDPFQNISFLSLAVIPELRITHRGIYSVPERKFLMPPDSAPK